jgi:hypothetical protein
MKAQQGNGFERILTAARRGVFQQHAKKVWSDVHFKEIPRTVHALASECPSNETKPFPD